MGDTIAPHWFKVSVKTTAHAYTTTATRSDGRQRRRRTHPKIVTGADEVSRPEWNLIVDVVVEDRVPPRPVGVLERMTPLPLLPLRQRGLASIEVAFAMITLQQLGALRLGRLLRHGVLAFVTKT